MKLEISYKTFRGNENAESSRMRIKELENENKALNDQLMRNSEKMKELQDDVSVSCFCF